MAKQIKKKFIADNAIDETKIEIGNNQAIVQVDGKVIAQLDADGDFATDKGKMATKQEVSDGDDAIKGDLVEGDYSTVKALSDALKSAESSISNLDGSYATDAELASEIAGVTGNLDDAVNGTIELLDDALAAEKDATVEGSLAKQIADSQSELDATQTGAGLGDNGQYDPLFSNFGTNYLAPATNLHEADGILDGKIKDNADAIATLNGPSSVDGSVAKAIADVIDMAPEALNTLNELAAAIGDDANFAASVTQQITDAKDELKGQVSEAFDTMKEIEDEFARINGPASVAGSIDAKVAAEASARTLSDDNISSAAGLSPEYTYDADTQANYISSAQSLKDADDKLDAALKAEEVARIAEDALMLKLDGSRSMEADLSMSKSSLVEQTGPLEGGAIPESQTTFAYQFSGTSEEVSAFMQSIISFKLYMYRADTNEEFELDANVNDINILPEQMGPEFWNIRFDITGALYEAGYNDIYVLNLIDVISVTRSVEGSVSSKITGLADGVDASDAVNKGQMDAALASAASDTSALQNELDDTQTGAGLGDNGQYDPLSIAAFESWYLAGVNNLFDADMALDAQIKVNENAISTLNGDSSTEGSVAKAIADVIDMAPEALNTLNELAASIGDDANFAGTVTQMFTDLKGGVSEAFDTMKEIEDEFAKLNGDASVAGSVAKAVADEAQLRSDADTALSNRVDELESVTWKTISYVADAGFLADGFGILDDVTGAYDVVAGSVSVTVGRLALHEGSDYSVSVFEGFSNVELSPGLQGSEEAIEAGDIIHIKFQYKA